MEGLGHDYGLTLDATYLETSRGAWLELARVVGCDDGNLPEPETLAQLINLSAQTEQIGPHLHRAIQESTTESGSSSTAAHTRASRLLVGLQPSVVAHALMQQSNSEIRKGLLHAAIDALSPAALQTLARSASIVYQQTTSPALETLLAKLELQAARANDNGARADAELAYRDLLHHLIDTWAASTENATAAARVYPRSQPTDDGAPADVLPEPERVVQLALESGVIGNVVWAAVAALSGEPELRRLLGMLKDAPEGSAAAQLIGQRFATPEQLAQLLGEDPVDFDAVDTLLRHLQLASAEVLLAELANSNSRVTRRGIIDRLTKLGPAIEPLVTARLTDERWYVLRNMLHVLNEAGCSVAHISLASYQSHTDPRVRREAMQLLFKDIVTRDRALAMAFRDTDPSMLRTALKAARAGLSDSAVPILAKRILDPDFPPEFRLPSIQLLGRSKSMLALDALLRFAQGGTTLLGNPRLAPRSLEMLAALKGLARTWPQERRAIVLLELAATSTDEQIRAAAQQVGEDSVREADDAGLE